MTLATALSTTIKSQILDQLNVFKREDFRFEEGPHKYYLGDQELTSVTTYLHHFYTPFDSAYWSAEKGRQKGISAAAMQAEWDAIADRACYLGTEVHKWVEDFFNGIEGPLENLDPEVVERIQSFKRLYALRLHKLTPIAQELRMFNKDMRLAGTLDALFIDAKGDIYILDWKTNKKLVTDKDRNYSKMLGVFATEWDNNMNHYSVQTSIYRLMLHQAGIVAKGCFIIYIPPVGECQVHPCKDYRTQLVNHFHLNAAEYGVN
jgi:ATP-dependent exoDNAse (exonuclease V) beta subunit